MLLSALAILLVLSANYSAHAVTKHKTRKTKKTKKHIKHPAKAVRHSSAPTFAVSTPDAAAVGTTDESTRPIDLSTSAIRPDEVSYDPGRSADLSTIAARPAAYSTDEDSSFLGPHRLSLNIGFSYGWAHLDSLHSGVNDLYQTLGYKNAAPQSDAALCPELALRYYFPYHLLGQVGFNTIYNGASVAYNGEDLSNHNLMIEVPLLAGGYVSWGKYFAAHGALGPSALFFQRVFLNPVTSAAANTSLGFTLLGELEYLVTRSFSIGLNLRYRFAKSSDLLYVNRLIDRQGKVHEAGSTITSGALRGDSSAETYNLDMSGWGLGISLNCFIF